MTEDELNITADEMMSDLALLILEVAEFDEETAHRLYGKLSVSLEKKWKDTRPHLRNTVRESL
jgi:hypothetical protein